MLRRLRWRIICPYLLLVLLSVGGEGLYLIGCVREATISAFQQRLLADARSCESDFATAFQKGDDLATLCRHYGSELGERVVVFDAQGDVLADSAKELGTLDVSHSLSHALSGEWIEGTYLSQGQLWIFAMAPLRVQGHTVGALCLVLPLEETGALLRARRALLWGMVGVSLAAFLLGIGLVAPLAREIQHLREGMNRVSQGRLGTFLLPSKEKEIGELTRAFNRMVEHLQENFAQLNEERTQLESILEYMADGVLITNDEGDVQLINAAASRILQTLREEALGKPLGQVVRQHQIIDLWRACVERQERRVEFVELRQQELFLRVFALPLQQIGQRTCLLMLQDLSQVRRLETVRREFMSNISHELRTPLASLKALVDTLREGALDDPPAAQRFLDQMDAEVDALTQMVQELLELSRIESGRVPIRLAPVSVEDCIRAPIERLRPQAERAGLDLQVSLPSNLPSVLGDAERLQQVVSNLVHNAIKFTPKGGRILVSAKVEMGEVIVSVSDTGIGIPKEMLPRIFERFFKADRSRSGGGTGLGLAIAKHIIQAHGGRIWAESTEGQGSTFYFSLLIGESASDL